MANEHKKDFNAMLRGRKNLRYYVQDFENALQSF